MGKLIVDEGEFSKVSFVDSSGTILMQVQSCLQRLTSVLLGREERQDIFANLHPAFGQTKAGRELFLYLLLLSSLQLKIILTLNCHILERHILPPFPVLIRILHFCLVNLKLVLRLVTGAESIQPFLIYPRRRKIISMITNSWSLLPLKNSFQI